ncbi:uncharacterized protein [Ptychodera flava]|uniref:uncharacterized protein isoform X1 n=1 Tax=Ptychodera flava TaxID=63121 RepID=UPI00396A8535
MDALELKETECCCTGIEERVVSVCSIAASGGTWCLEWEVCVCGSAESDGEEKVYLSLYLIRDTFHREQTMMGQLLPCKSPDKDLGHISWQNIPFFSHQGTHHFVVTCTAFPAVFSIVQKMLNLHEQI